jgi:hypothetical protein
MTKTQAVAEFKECVGQMYRNDPIAKRIAWANFIDILHRQGLVTDQQVNNWSNPY